MEHKTQKELELDKEIRENLERILKDNTPLPSAQDDENYYWVEFLYKLHIHKCYNLLMLLDKTLENKK